MAALLPPSKSDNKRERRKYQDQLLASQIGWPDFAAIKDSAFLICVDHKPPEIGLPLQLYKHQNLSSPVKWDNFEPILDQLIQAVSPIESPIWLAKESWVRESLTSVIFEAFKNTHDHAREEVSGAEVETSVRCIYTRFYSMEEVLTRIASIDPIMRNPVEKYVAGFTTNPSKLSIHQTEKIPVTGFLEISILDSGPGMAARWLGIDVNDIERQRQLDAVIKCFQKGQSSTQSDGRGYGLWKVLLSLEKLQGFLSVRTNNIHGYRQFGKGVGLSTKELASGQQVEKEKLLDWKKGASTAQSVYPHVKGTVVSFMLPMGGA